MAVNVGVTVPDVASQFVVYGPGGLVRLERSATEDGVYAEVGTQALVEGQDHYVFGSTLGGWFRSRLSRSDGSSPSDYSDPFTTSEPTVVAVETVRALTGSGLPYHVLEGVIRREEEALAAEVGPLTGERTETFVITDRTSVRPVRLLRRAASVVVTEGNEEVDAEDVRLVRGRIVQRLVPGEYQYGEWEGVVEVTSTPSDLAEVTAGVVDLVRARLAETGFETESIEGYTYTRGARRYDEVFARVVGALTGRGVVAARTASRRLRSVRVSTSPVVPVLVGSDRP